MLGSILTIILCVGFAWADHHETSRSTARWCTITESEYQKCLDMSSVFANNDLTPSISCVELPTVEECLIDIHEGKADLITLDGGDVFRAGKVFGMRPIVKEIYPSSSAGYFGIAVTKAEYTNVTLTNLRGARTCHTGVGRTAGWNIPVGYLLNSGQMESLGCKEHAKSAANFFQASCAPGAQLAINNPYNDDFSNLCGICAGDCNRDSDTEPYNGYSGALRCLIEGKGEVAFIKPATLEASLGENAPDWAAGIKKSDLQLLCKDGSRADIDDPANCHISKCFQLHHGALIKFMRKQNIKYTECRQWRSSGVSHSVMTSGTASDEDIASYQALLLSATDLFSADYNEEFTMFDSSRWNDRNLIFKDYAQSMEVVEEDNYRDYLGGYGESFEGLHKCPDNTVRFCTVSEQEQLKCRAMRDAFLEAGLTPEISCFPSASHAECIDNIAAGFADIVTLDGGDIYRAGKDHGLISILGEVYTDMNQPVSYWAVAVVKKDASFNIDELAGKRSCHTGIMKTSGWIMPVGYLAQNGFIRTDKEGDICNVTAAVGNFFASSCVPGAKTRAYDVHGSNPENLCQNCIGKDENFCARNSHEPYYGYSGAFRCLAEGAGDVAFVKHTTIRENTRPNGQEEWNRDLKLKNFKLLCPDGTTKEPWKYKECHLGQVPSHAVMTSSAKKESEIKEIVELLEAGMRIFDDDQGEGFKMFDSAGYLDNEGNSGKNLLFKDSTVELRSLYNMRRYDRWLGDSYLKALETIRCERN